MDGAQLLLDLLGHLAVSPDLQAQHHNLLAALLGGGGQLFGLHTGVGNALSQVSLEMSLYVVYNNVFSNILVSNSTATPKSLP